MLARSPAWWEWRILLDPAEDRHGASALAMAVWEEGEGAGPAAYALYRSSREWTAGVPRGSLNVIEAMGASPLATREIWRFLLGIDLNEAVRAWLLPADHALRLLVAEPRRLGLTLVDNFWLRLIDVRKALESRAYRGEGSLVLEVADTFLPSNAGRWRLHVSHSRAHVERSRQKAGLRLSVNDLAAAYLGGFTFAQLAAAGRVEGLEPSAVTLADDLFRTARAPWCPEIF